MIIILTVILVALQIFDYVSTIKALESGKGIEANPLVRWFMDKLGTRQGLAALKALGIAVAFFLYSTGSIIGIGLLVALYGYVVFNNFRIYNKD
jgi:hypothetical protein